MWKEFNPDENRSIKDDFQNKEYDHFKEIAAYLENGKISLVSTECGVDVVTNERIFDTCCILTDGEYTWLNTLGYYVRNYYLKLPKEFEQKVLKTVN